MILESDLEGVEAANRLRIEVLILHHCHQHRDPYLHQCSVLHLQILGEELPVYRPDTSWINLQRRAEDQILQGQQFYLLCQHVYNGAVDAIVWIVYMIIKLCYCLNRQPRKKPNLDLDIQFSGTDCQVKYSFHSLLLSIVFFLFFWDGFSSEKYFSSTFTFNCFFNVQQI